VTVLIQKTEPVEQTRVFIKSGTVLSAINHSFSLPINFIENALKYFFVYFNVAVYDARPVHDYVCEISAKLLKVDITSLSHIHQPKTKLIAFVCRAVAHNVHRSGKLFQR